MDRINHFINGEFIESQDYIPGINPASEEVIYQLANGDVNLVDQAVIAAKNSFSQWSGLSNEARAEYLFKLANLIEDNAEKLAELESIDNGKPLSLAQNIDIPRAASNFNFFAKAICQTASLCHDSPSSLNVTLNQAIGPVACISPWNLPLYLLTWKIAPALAAGATVVAKPSELTPATANELAHLCLKAGLPPGVLNIIHGYGKTTGEALINHPDIKAVSFTGGTQTGQHIAKTLAPKFKKMSLELGGKNAAIIFADSNYEKMLSTTIKSSFSNQGEICLCTSRIFVEKSIYQRFKHDFVARASKLIVGHPSDPSTQLGALVSKEHQTKVAGFVTQAKQNGGNILCGGESLSINGKGYYHQATVIEGLANTDPVNQQEIFGPVVCLIPFIDEQAVISEVNDCEFGLATTLWTESLSRGHRMAKAIDSGIVWVNCWMLRDLRTPFGGMKNSGIGREGGFDALQFFTEKKNICFATE